MVKFRYVHQYLKIKECLDNNKKKVYLRYHCLKDPKTNTEIFSTIPTRDIVDSGFELRQYLNKHPEMIVQIQN